MSTVAFYQRIADMGAAPLWHHGRELLPVEPTASAVPSRWRYGPVREALLDASRLVDPKEAERRVLMLLNPGLHPTVATTPNLLAGVQMLLPGEVARAHRHTAAAVRFVIEGRGACTVTDGVPVPMEPGDLVLTPSWTWHDHESAAAEPVLWFDGLDLPLVRSMEAGFFEQHAELRQPVTGPVTAEGRRPVQYPWASVAQALSSLAQDRVDGGDMVTVDYVHPSTGGPVTRTIGCRASLLSPHRTSHQRRETASSIFHVVSGEGASLISDTEVTWSQGDIFVVPGWAPAVHTNTAAQPALLFSMTDEPVLRSLGLYRSA
ncbi:MAG: cupin domain-containing protein [Acidimicrobiales bacterium]